MSPGKIISWGMSLVIFLMISVMMIEYYIPLNAKANFNSICSNYMIKAETYGGLSNSDEEELRSKLDQIGLDNIQISYPGKNSKKKGQDINLKIDGIFSYKQVTGFALKKEKSLYFTYDRRTISKRVTNN